MTKTISTLLSISLPLFSGIADTGAPNTPPPRDALPASSAPLKDAKADAWLDGEFRCGFYLYLWSWDQTKDPAAKDVEEQIERMAAMGFNYVYVAGAAESPIWHRVLEVCTRLRMAVVAQLGGGAYLTPDSNIDKQVGIAARFINAYKNHPAVLYFLIKEEPSPSFMPRVEEYYSKLLTEVPDAPLYLLHNGLKASEIQKPPYPVAVGTDRYPFWFEFGVNNNRATPSSALRWYHTQIDAFYQHAKERGQAFEVVLTDWVQQIYRDQSRILKSLYPQSADDEVKEKTLSRLERLAEAGNHGISQGPDGKIHIWKYYRPPANCLAAMGWLAVMEGAHAVSNYTWSRPNIKEEIRFCGTFGWDEQGLPSTTEYAAFLNEVRPFGRLVRAMTKETTPVLNEPQGHEDVQTAAPKAPPIRLKEPDAIWRSFTIPGYDGRVVIVVNTQVGSWSDGRSPDRLEEKDPFRIDDEGNLLDYRAYHLPRKLSFHLAGDVGGESDEECIDLGSGASVELDANGSGALWISPGRGKIVFIGKKGSGEAARLRAEFNLPGRLEVRK